jgi:hypothetical protein
MLHASSWSSAPRSRPRQTPRQLSDTRLDALAKAWTAQDRARLKAQRTATPRLSRNRVWQRIQDELEKFALTQSFVRMSH